MDTISVQIVPDAAAVPAAFMPGVVAVAIKPQVAAGVLPGLGRFGGVFLSIMAGWPLARLQAMAPGRAWVRAMPNTPAAIRQGVTVACAAAGVTPAQIASCNSLLSAMGPVAWIADESQMDAVTAVSGCGPAYVFLLAELMEQAGLDNGLPPDLARLLARQTVAGSGALLAASAQSAADLRKAVTSPNGVTQQALQVLMQANAWPQAMTDAVAAAIHRSQELAKGS